MQNKIDVFNSAEYLTKDIDDINIEISTAGKNKRIGISIFKKWSEFSSFCKTKKILEVDQFDEAVNNESGLNWFATNWNWRCMQFW